MAKKIIREVQNEMFGGYYAPAGTVFNVADHPPAIIPDRIHGVPILEPVTSAIVEPIETVEPVIIEPAPQSQDKQEPTKKGKLNMDDATKPATESTVLDSETHYCKVDLLKHLDDAHIIKRLSLSIANATDLPPSTVFLTGLGVFSSVACRQWRVNYPRGGSLPIGLDVTAEQPPATSKSRCLTTFQKPFLDVYFDEMREIKKALEAANDGKKDKLQSDQLKNQLFVTNPTPEALEETLSYSKGFFSAVSSEQGMINTLLGLSYGDGKQSNNDLLLNSFDGGYINVIRQSREGYRGYVAGGVVLFAQNGCVEKILTASNGTGLSERFLMLVEPSSLGFRNWLGKPRHIDDDCVNDYAKICKKITGDIFINPKELRDLQELTISPEGWQMINQYRHDIEPHLKDGGRYSHISLRGAAGKIDMQIMKISANLQLLRGVKGDVDLGNYPIDNDLVKTSILIVADLLEGVLTMLKDKGLVGTKAEYNAILSIFEKDSRAKTFEQIRPSRSKVEPFRSHTGNKAALIKSTLDDMVADGILSVTALDGGGLSYELIR
jgi:hypothetical protein